MGTKLLITADEANNISRNSQKTNPIDIEINKQIDNISSLIISTAKKGFYNCFYDYPLYSETIEILKNHGFKVNIICKEEDCVKIFQGINISWYKEIKEEIK